MKESMLFLTNICIYINCRSALKLLTNRKRDGRAICFIRFVYMQMTFYRYSMTTLAIISTGTLTSTASLINLILYANIGVRLGTSSAQVASFFFFRLLN